MLQAPKNIRLNAFIATLALAATTTAAHAVAVVETIVNVGGNTWLVGFDLINDGSLPAVESITIYLDHSLASNLTAVNAPLGWDALVVQPDTALASDGYFDALALDPAAAAVPGVPQYGFAFKVDWLPAAAPGSFSFTVNDPITFAVLERGVTAAVPEPAAWWMAAMGLSVLAWRTRRADALAHCPAA